MKVLIVGGKDANSIESIYHEVFQKIGQSRLFPAKTLFREYYNKSIVNKLLFKVGLSHIYQRINEDFKKQVLEYRPDVIFVFKGMELLPDVLQWARQQAYLVMYNPDHPFIYSGKGSGNDNMSQSIQQYHLYITYASDIQKELEKKGINTERVPFGYNLSLMEYEMALSEPEELKVCFLGNGDTYRENILNSLAEKGLPLVVHGSNWSSGLHQSIEVKGGAYGLDFWRILRRYRIQLNIMRKHNLNSHNMRTFDIPAVGGIQLAPDTPEHREFFDENEIELYTDIDDCYSKAVALLETPLDQVLVRRQAARERSMNSRYNYTDRARDMWQLIHTNWKEHQR